VTVDDEYLALIEHAPQQDFVLRTLARRMAGDTPLMIGELVIAGRATRERYPLAEAYPLHFRKTYYPGRLRGDTAVEFERHKRASEILGIPPPIGCAGGTFRSCLLPGRPLDRVLEPFFSEPEEGNIQHADKLTLASAAGLWHLCERLFAQHMTLQRAGLAHGDAALQNFIVCPAPLDVLPIDFDMAVLKDALSEEDWRERSERDLEPLLKAAVFLQCALGAQASALGELSLGKIALLFKRGALFRRAIDDRARLLSAL
jgi:hypothetical protein